MDSVVSIQVSCGGAVNQDRVSIKPYGALIGLVSLPIDGTVSLFDSLRNNGTRLLLDSLSNDGAFYLLGSLSDDGAFFLLGSPRLLGAPLFSAPSSYLGKLIVTHPVRGSSGASIPTLRANLTAPHHLKW